MPATELDPRGVERVTLNGGLEHLDVEGHACNYISAGGTNEGPIVVLVRLRRALLPLALHHPALARPATCTRCACSGAGGRPGGGAIQHEFWGEQVIAFAKEVACASESDKAVIAGNSIGALAALYAAANAEATGACAW